mgnify:FL=1
MEVCGLGTIAMDVLMQVDMLPQKDGFCMVKNTSYQPGGSGSNVIVQLARLGAKCGYIAALSKDRYGLDILNNLKAEGVDTSCMEVFDKGVTLHTDIVIDQNGDKFIMLNMGDTFEKLEFDDMKKLYVEKAKVFYTDLCPGKPAMKAITAARNRGIETVFNMQVGLATMNGLGVSKEELLACIREVDVFAPCRQGLFDLTGTENLDECCGYLRNYTDAVLLFTLGSGGSAAYDRDGTKYEVPCKKVNVIDTTGAGDSYMGGFIYSYCIKGKDLLSSMRFATSCAAHTCSGLVARFSPDLEMVGQYL